MPKSALISGQDRSPFSRISSSSCLLDVVPLESPGGDAFAGAFAQVVVEAADPIAQDGVPVRDDVGER